MPLIDGRSALHFCLPPPTVLLGRRQAPDGPGGSSPKHFLLSRALSRAHVPSCPLTLSRGGLESPPAVDCGLLCGAELPPPSTRAPRVGSSFPKWQHGGVSLDTASPGQKPGRRPSHPVRMLLPSHESSPSSHHRHIILISQVCEQATSPKARGSSQDLGHTGSVLLPPTLSVAPTCPLLGLTWQLPFP